MQITNTFDPARIDKIARQVKHMADNSRDFVVDRRNMKLALVDGQLCLSVGGMDNPELFATTRRSLRQLCGTLKLPVRYADRLTDEGHSDLLIENVNTLFAREHKIHMVRTLDSDCRAFLSSSYKTISNYDVLKVAASEATKVGGELWDLRLDDDGGHFRTLIVNKDVRGQVNTDRNFNGRWRWRPEDHGDPYLYPAVTIGNSETGEGSYFADLSLLNGICCNFFVWERKLAKVHLGAKKEAVGELVFSEETRAAESELVLARTRDVLRAAFDPVRFKAICDKINETTTRNIPEEAKATEVVNATLKLCKLHEEHAEMVLEHFLRSGDKTQFGLANALNEAVNPENRPGSMGDALASSFEDAAGLVLGLSERRFNTLVRV